MTKPILADNIRQNLLKKYGSIADACRLMDLDYESCKKSLTRNTFSPTQLNILFHGVPINELQEKFTFRLARAYKKTPYIKNLLVSVACLISSMMKTFISSKTTN